MTTKERKHKRGDRLQVQVEKLAVGGKGVARHEGLVIFVSDAAPEEKVEIELTFVKKNFAEARLLRVLSPSRFRITPPCPVAGICGGCSWQHVEYEEQLRQKRLLVAESLRKFSGQSFEVDNVLPVIASPKPFRYRNRVQLHHSGPKLGYHRRGSHDIVDIEDCPITEEVLAQRIPILKKELAHLKAGRIEIAITTDGKIRERKSGKQDQADEPASEVTGPAFSQVNTEQNRNLIDFVLKAFVEEISKETGKETPGGVQIDIYDLYSGSGNFTFPLADQFPQARLIAAELNAEAVALGRERAERESSKRARTIEFHEADIETFLEGRSFSTRSFVLLDPPRAGCGLAVMEKLAEAQPEAIVYVSCHPVTLARDLKTLIEKGYEVLSVQPFDMFPQTDHIECVARLRRSR